MAIADSSASGSNNSQGRLPKFVVTLKVERISAGGAPTVLAPASRFKRRNTIIRTTTRMGRAQPTSKLTTAGPQSDARRRLSFRTTVDSSACQSRCCYAKHPKYSGRTPSPTTGHACIQAGHTKSTQFLLLQSLSFSIKWLVILLLYPLTGVN